MTLNVPSFFAGIGTVVLLLTLGFGGGVMMSGMINDKPREPGKVEKWAAEQKAPAETKTPAEAPKPPVITARRFRLLRRCRHPRRKRSSTRDPRRSRCHNPTCATAISG